LFALSEIEPSLSVFSVTKARLGCSSYPCVFFLLTMGIIARSLNGAWLAKLCDTFLFFAACFDHVAITYLIYFKHEN
jgi:hypothetical protein